MSGFYVFYRLWPGFTGAFPVEQFNDFPDDQIESELRKAADDRGPSDEAIMETHRARSRAQLDGVLDSGRRRSSLPMPPITGQQLEEWLRQRRKEDADARARVGEKTLLLIRKLQSLRWLRAPVLWDWGFRKRIVIVSVDDEADAKLLVEALNTKYKDDPRRPRFGYFKTASVPPAERLLYDQAVDQRLTEALDTASATPQAGYRRTVIDLTPQAGYTRTAIDLLRRIQAQHTGDGAKEGDETASLPGSQGENTLPLLNEVAIQGGEQPKRPGRGRPIDTSPQADAKITEAWETGRYQTYDQLAREKGITKRDVKLSIDRHRKRQR
jgi:hypothetical protein